MNKKLLLHSCCGPCSTSVIEKLKDEYDLCIFFYNPNITDKEEYEKRRLEQIKVIEAYGLPFIDGDYEPEVFYQKAQGLEDEPEGGRRCEECFKLRMKASASLAKEKGFDYFATTLSVSPHKSYKTIVDIGSQLEEEEKVIFLADDFKKKAGFQRSIEISKEMELYRQKYCGCEFSK